MSLLLTFTTIAGCAAGGAAGFVGGFFMKSSWRRDSVAIPTFAGAFLGAALGAATGWGIDGGVNRYMYGVGERAVINNCLKRMDRGEAVMIGRNAANETSCVPAAPRP